MFAPGALEEAPDEGGGGEEDVAGHGPPEGNDTVAEAVEEEGGGEPEDDGDEACGPHDEAGVACAFEGTAEDDVEGVACGPDEEDEGEHFADLEVVGKVNASFFGVEEAQEGFVGEADKEYHKNDVAETDEGTSATCACGAVFVLRANALANEDAGGHGDAHKGGEDEVVDGEDDVAGGKAEFVKASGKEDEDGEGGDVEENVAAAGDAITDDAAHKGKFEGKGNASAVGGGKVFFANEGDGKDDDDKALADGGGNAGADDAEFGNGAVAPDEEGVEEDVGEVAEDIGGHHKAGEPAAREKS